ncbi:GNAT family N-acetyltransferase [Companilactobacillus zhongbaensis]|uniref:GNAT family N-acetyltransferase n=1 Tax=Companilactobacillus zhongbaensis TaxID=2486009 RepID=UPI000F7A0411|nr:GNAT family N-acetyltransferase [Companilactobacillus zhongbaensis]
MHEIKTTTDLNSQIYRDCLNIRTKVFVEEQKVPADMEVDDYEDKCKYYTLYVDQTPAATARYYPTDDNGIHVQRVAVSKDFRKQGLASEVINRIIKDAKTNGYSYVILGAQDQANGFYKKLGFKVVGGQYLDAGILHHDMRKEI